MDLHLGVLNVAIITIKNDIKLKNKTDYNMKFRTWFIRLMLLATLQSNGQKNIKWKKPHPDYDISSVVFDPRGYCRCGVTPVTHTHISQVNDIRFVDSPMYARYKQGSDTLEILRPDKIRFIRIGERVYMIDSPTLIEVTNNKGSAVFTYGPITLKYGSLMRYPIFYNMKVPTPPPADKQP